MTATTDLMKIVKVQLKEREEIQRNSHIMLFFVFLINQHVNTTKTSYNNITTTTTTTVCMQLPYRIIIVPHSVLVENSKFCVFSPRAIEIFGKM